jgi:tRNA modification GTPase
MHTDDTITALATPSGAGAISVIRISGKNTFNIVSKIIPENKNIFSRESHTCFHSKIISPLSGEIIDDALITVFKSPKSYTSEDTVEISTHGGAVIPYRVLNLLLECGARQAEKGEFTKRAFLNNKLDLTQAEAVCDAISSPTVTGARLAVSNIFKKFKTEIDCLKDNLINLLAHLEVCIDYPDEDIPEASTYEIENIYSFLKSSVTKILSDSKRGRRLSAGVIVVLMGKTNVGKSSVLNCLSREERAIVSSVHGTTRDALEINIEIEGVPLTIVDTAGIRDAGDELERMGIEKTHKYLDEAHLVLFVLDASSNITAEDKEIYEKIKNKEHLIILNKSDLKSITDNEKVSTQLCKNKTAINVSAFKKSGIDKLENALTLWVRGHEEGVEDNAVVASLRSELLLKEALDAASSGIMSVRSAEPSEFSALLFRDALNALAKITGEVTTEDVLERIFEKFCIGK